MTTVTKPSATEISFSRHRPVWLTFWPLLPIIIYLTTLFVYPVSQLLWLSIVDNQGALTS